MKTNVWLWRTLGFVTLVCTLVLLAGFGWALKDTWLPSAGMALSEPAAPQEASGGSWSDKKEIVVTALGDSLTVGVGDPEGDGYVKRAADGLTEAFGKPVRVVSNLAISGLLADELARSLDQKGYKESIAKADLVFLTIGGNDLFQLANNGSSMAEGGDLSPELLKERLPEAQERLAIVFQKLRAINPQMRLVYIGLYNPFYDLHSMRPASEIIQQWNAIAHELALGDGNATVVPTYDLFESNINAYLASDHFHPNAAGYARIAERVKQAVQ